MDNWFLGHEEETTDMVIQAERARLWVQDADGNRRDLVVSHSEVYLLGYGFALGWVQVRSSDQPTPFDIAFNMLLRSQF